VKHTHQSSGILFLFFLIIITPCAFAQPHPLRFQHLSIEQGLSANLVYAVTQDKHGFIWLGTSGGLNRFDGNRIEVYRQKLGDKTSLPGNAIICLFTDTRGILWIGTASGLAYFDEHTNSFHTFVNNPEDSNSLPNNFINVINEDARGLLWIGTGQGLCSFDVKNNRFQRFLRNKRSDNSISSNQIMDIKFAPDGSMWIATIKGLNRFDMATGKFTSFYHDPADSSTLSTNSLLRIAIDKDGNLWTGSISETKLHLDRFNTRTYRCKQFIRSIEKATANPNSFMGSFFPGVESQLSLFLDKSGRLWIGSFRSGLILFFPDRNIFYQYKMDPLDPASLHSNAISGIYQDHSGMIWLSTFAGADRVNIDESKFTLYRSQSLGPFPTQKSVHAFGEDTLHRLWIGTSEGLYILDRNTGKSTRYHWNQKDTQTLSANFITTICRDNDGNMWIGTMYGLKMINLETNKIRSFYAEKNNHSIASNIITSLVCAENGDLLIGCRPGFSIYKTKTQQFVNFNNDTLHALLNRRNNVVFEDSRGIIWLGTQGSGLIRYDPKSGKLKNFTRTVEDTSSLAAVYACSFAQDHTGVVWVGTSSGLSRFNEKTQTFTTLTDEDGLPNVRIKQLLVDEKDRIWMATNSGLSMLDESRTAFTNYDPSDGLQGGEFSEPSAFKTHDGYFCYGGQNGFNMFHQDSIKKNLFVPPVTLKGITIFDEPLSIDGSYSSLRTLRLSYKQNFFSFEFASLNYDHPEKNQYACQLVGFDKRMIQLGTNHTVSYTNVPPGNYTLKVKASNNDGVWNEAGYELNLIIVPPFWGTWWFRTIMIAIFIGAVFLFFKLRENKIRKKQVHQTAINRQIAEIRMTALRAQMNPHFIFNSLNSIQHFIAIRENEEALSYLSKFSKLIRKILENSFENTVSISNELQLLELYIQLEQRRFDYKFDYHIDVDKKLDTENTRIPPLLIQPYIENAILHGLINKDDKGDLWLSLEKNNGWLICKIEDNGIGRAGAQEIEQRKAAKHKSLGLKVTSDRVSTLSGLLDKKMEVIIEDLFEKKQTPEETQQSAGTRVTITIPVREEE
jgi:ligand-binding sensor domain-containing protein/two-component sensor histidine kinase